MPPDDHRDPLAQDRAVFRPHATEPGVARRPLSDGDRAHYDASLGDWCDRAQTPFQPDSFALASACEDAPKAIPSSVHP